jgi:hypothetical protein
VSDENNDNLDPNVDLPVEGDPIDARALRFMVHEMQAEATPEIDWMRLEDALIAAIEPSHVSGDGSVLDGAVGSLAPSSVVSSSAAHSLAEQERPSLTALVSPHADIYVPEPLAGEDEAADAGNARVARWSRRTRWGVLAAAAVALVTLGFGFGRFSGLAPAPADSTVAIEADRWVDPTTMPLAEGLPNVYDLGALRAGDVVEASWGDLSFGRAGLMTWTLSAGSRLMIRSGIGEPRHVVVLESGSLHAVMSDARSKEERFVIEAGDTRVALFGADGANQRDATVANVSLTRSTKGLVVDVEGGVASVGTKAGRVLHRLSAGDRGTLSLDGGETYQVLPAEALRADHAPVVLVAPPVAPMPRAPHVEAVANAEPTPSPTAAKPEAFAGKSETVADQVMNEATARASLERCFAEVESRSAKSDNQNPVSVTVRSTLNLGLREDGSVKSAIFSPPLRADLQNCAVGLLKAKFDRSKPRIAIPVEIKK